MYSPSPRMKRGSSLRLTEWPMPPTAAVVWGVSWTVASAILVALAQLAAAGSAGASWEALARSSLAAWSIALTMLT